MFFPATALVAVGKDSMSYRELSMIDVKDVLRRWSAGHSNRQIAREAARDRDTVARYIRAAEELGIARGHEFTDDEVHAVAQCVQARRIVEPSAEWKAIAEHHARIAKWLGADRPLKLTKIYTLLVGDGVTASYDTLRRYAQQELGFRKKEPTILLADPPAGQEAQIDFGRMGLLHDVGTERPRTLWALIVTLSLSRYQFVWPTFVQTTASVCEGLDRAWAFFGGMTKTIVPDNMKAIIQVADPLTPTINPAFLDYAQARGIFVDATRVRSPKDKPRVENQVSYVRESWFGGERFLGLDDARQSAEQWCRDVAGARVHGTTRQVPRDVYAVSEKPAMLPAPTEPFDVPIWIEKAKVHPDHHIQVLRALYSVPTLYIGEHVRARADSMTVKIYLRTELIKVHPRKLPGGRSTDVSDYPAEKAAYALRSVDALIAQAKKKGTHVGIFAERLLAGPLPWTRMRQGYALLRLCDKFSAGRVEAVCQSALAFDVLDVGRVARMLKAAAQLPTPETTTTKGKVVQLTLPRFARPQEHFETRTTTASKKGGAS